MQTTFGVDLGCYGKTIKCYKAGIDGTRLSIALEPEAASLYCRHLQVEKPSATYVASFRPGTKYLVLDAGGGTVDITVHEVTMSGDLKELHKASGGAWGGTKVDEAFENLIDNITRPGVMKRFKEAHMDDYIDLMQNFEINKREITPVQNDEKITIRLPVTLLKMVTKRTGKTMAETIQESRYKYNVGIGSDRIRIDKDVASSLFGGAVNSIVRHVKSLLREPSVQGCEAIVMVGGFGESKVLQKIMKEKFPRMKIIVPFEAGLAVLKGAVIFGHSPNSITERIGKFIDGDGTSHQYSQTCEHKVGRRKIDENGDLQCYDLSRVHIHACQSLKEGEAQEELFSTPISDDQDVLHFEIYVSKATNSESVAGIGCTKLGSLTVPLRGKSLARNRKVGCKLMFEGTEIEVIITDKAFGTENM